jgi:protein-S-isoprenylcysteine O-methyltransferase Ste14
MGASHLFFALASTGYVAIGVMFEERDLRRTFGVAYERYAARVPAVVPSLTGRRSDSMAGGDGEPHRDA